MTRLKIVLVFISLFGICWYTLPSPLPPSWTPESKVRFTATILEQPEYTDSKTIIRSGVWYVPITGYAEIIPGSRVAFVGKVVPQVLGKKITRIVMTDPTFEVVTQRGETKLGLMERGLMGLRQGRDYMVSLLEIWLPEPMSSLAAGILLGVKGQMPTEFYQQLVNTGTLHIIAASGFNVMIVASVLMSLAQRLARRGLAVGMGVTGIWVYVLLSGAGASVIRAGIMGSLTLMAYYWGRPAEAKRLLWITAGVMLLINPLMLVDIGFQLSVAATAGLLYLGAIIQNLDTRLQIPVGIKTFLSNYLYPTLAATLATMPVILWHFGRVSWISPGVNMLVLPVVPLIMGMSAGVIGLGVMSATLGQGMAWFLYVPLAYLVWVIRWFG